MARLGWLTLLIWHVALAALCTFAAGVWLWQGRSTLAASGIGCGGVCLAASVELWIATRRAW